MNDLIKLGNSLAKKTHGSVLRPHQYTLFERFSELPPEGLLLYHSMRSGKTFTAATLAKYRQGFCLIVCPRQVVAAWHKQMKSIGMYRYRVTTYANCNKIKYPTIATLIFDEIHYCRSQGRGITKTSKDCLEVANSAEYVLGLTGTLFDKDASELYFIAKLIGGDSILTEPNVSNFYKNWCFDISKSAKYVVWQMHQHLYREDFIPSIRPYIDYHKSDDREPRQEFLKYSLRSEQTAMMDALRNHRYPVDWDVPAEGWEPSVLNQKTLQIAGGFCLDNSVMHEIVRPHICDKWQKVEELLRDGVPTVFFYRFTHEEGLVRASGERNNVPVTPFKTYAKLKDKTGIKHLIGHPQNTGVGVDLREFDRIVYLSETPSNILATQSAARLNVFGQDVAEKKILYLVSFMDYSKRLRSMHQEKERAVREFCGLIRR